jgi:RNA polymerase sigma-32 factor
MNSTLDMPVAVAAGASLDSYIQAVNSVPMLTPEEERDLAARYRRENDLVAARRLVLSHLRFVVKVARGYGGYGLPLADLIQEGSIGLMKAVKRFDPAVGVRLVSFAVHWIKAEMHEYIIRNWRIVKIATTKAQRKLFFNLRNTRRRLGWMGRNEVDDVARELGVSSQDVLEMEARMNGYDASFDMLPDSDEDHQPVPANYLEDTRFEPEARLADAQIADWRRDALARSLAELDPRSREIIERRWLSEDSEKATLHELAAHYGVSAERIRQIEKSAIGKLKSFIGGQRLLPAAI